jgi:hypothetical protein
MKRRYNMPGGDRTGPDGIGPQTGRRLGYCSGYDSPGYTKGFFRCGFGYGRGFGRGYGRGFGRGRGRRGYYPYPDEFYYRDRYYSNPREGYPAINDEDEKHYLENLIHHLENEMKNIKNRLQELAKKNDDKSP